MSGQATLFMAAGLCWVGTCGRRATHRACWRKLPSVTMYDGTIAHLGLPPGAPVEGHVECCLDHANYYAEAWTSLHVVTYPHLWEEHWMEEIGAFEGLAR